jgi:hypothetical protein
MEPKLSEFNSLQQEAVDEKTSSDRLLELARLSIELAQRVAKNPRTPPDLLRELGNSRDYTTRKNVAANPNTPTEVLLKLGAEFPEQLLDNPIFSLLLLENPNLIEQIPRTTLLSLLKCETVPASFLERAANKRDREVYLALATNARTSKAVLEKLVESHDAEISEVARLHVNWAGEMTSGWDEAAREAIGTTDLRAIGTTDLAQSKLSSLGKRGFIPNFAIAKLARHKDWGIRSFVAQNPSTPANLLEQLAQDEEKGVRGSVARNPNAPANVLEQLAQDRDNDVRKNVARNPNTPVKVLEQLAQDKDHHVRGFVAQNPNAPVNFFLEAMLKDDVPDSTPSLIRFLVLLHSQTPSETLADNLGSQAWLERYAIAQNPNTSTDILKALAKDANRIVRAAAKANLQSRQAKI